MLHSVIPSPEGMGALTAETLSDLEDIDSVAGEWLALERHSITPIFFQSFSWCRFVMQTWRQMAGEFDYDPRIVIVRNSGRLVLVWPLAVSKVMSGRIAQDLTEPFGQYSDALLEPDVDSVPVIDAAWAEIKRWKIDALLLQRVREDASIRAWLLERAHRVGETREAPYVDLGAFENFAAYHGSIRAKTRKNLRNYRNRLGRMGTVQHRLITDRTEVRQLTRLCLNWRTEWLSSSGLSSAAFQHAAFDRIIDGLADGANGAPPLQMMMLALDRGQRSNGTSPDDIVAIQWGFRHRDRYYAFMSARNPDLDAYSPGRLHLEDVIRTCAAEGLNTVDLLVPRVPYKDTWATGSTKVDSFGVSNGLRGRLIVDVWHNFARPALKSAMLKLPTGVRKFVFRQHAKRHAEHDTTATKSKRS